MKKSRIYAFFICAAMILIFLPSTARSDTPIVVYVDYDITEDTTWHSGDYYICKVGNREPQILNGAKLTIESGTNVYFSTRTTATLPGTESSPKNPYSSLTVTNGTLSATGVTFTTVPDETDQTTWQDAGWNGIRAIGAGEAGATSLSFINCIFKYSGFSDSGTIYGVQSNGINSEVNIFVSGCTFSNPKVGSTAIRYNNGSNTIGNGTISVTNSSFTGYGRSVQVEQNGDDNVNTTVSDCTFSNISIRPLEINGGRQAVVTGNSFNNFVIGQHDNPVLIYDGFSPTSTDQTVTLTGNTFNYGIDANIYPVVIGAGCKINEDITSPAISFSTDYPAAYRYIVLSRGVGYLKNHRNAVWGDTGIPYLLASEITITGSDASNKSTLTIKPGVTVCLGDGNGTDNLFVRGDLTAIGTANKPITFTKKAEVAYGNEIVVNNSLRGKITLDHCVMDGLYRGIGVTSPSTSSGLISLENCTVKNSQHSMLLIGYNVSIKNCSLIDKGVETGGGNYVSSTKIEGCSITSSGVGSDNGIDLNTAKGVILKNCLITGFPGYGVAVNKNIYETLVGGAPLIENCTITGNSYGVVFSRDFNLAYGAYIKNSIITDNNQLDIASKTYISGTSKYPVTVVDGSIAYSLIGNDGSNLPFDSGYYDHYTLGKIRQIATNTFSNRITGDPLFADATRGDYHLKSKVGRWNGSDWVNDDATSPCIDAGDPSYTYENEPEPNGGRINLGCYGNTVHASKSGDTIVYYTINFPDGKVDEYTAYTVKAHDSSISPVPHGGNYSFTIIVGDDFYKNDNFKVKANNIELTPNSDSEVYTIYGIMENQIITVEGVEKINTPNINISISSTPLSGGTVTGGGSVNAGSIIITAMANSGYRFVRWMEGDTQVSTSASYTFEATSDRTFVAVFEVIPIYNPPTSPVIPTVSITEIGSGKTVTTVNIEKLISERESLTVEGPDGAKLVFDTESLKGISKKASASIKVNITDKSDKYQDTHPGKAVFSLTVNSGDKIITDFGGTVTVSLPYKLNVGEVADNVMVWHLIDSGDMTPIPCTYDQVSQLVSFKVKHFSLYIVGVLSQWENPFTDVNESHWFYDAVQFVHKNNLMLGISEITFSPGTNTSRGMIVTILHRLEGLTESSVVNPFDDVASGKWYTDAVLWATEQGIVKGYGNGQFGPEDDITREQMAVILMNYAKFKGFDVSMKGDLSKYMDAGSISSWAKDAISWANATALIQGEGVRLMPTDNAERCHVAAILQRFIEDIAK